MKLAQRFLFAVIISFGGAAFAARTCVELLTGRHAKSVNQLDAYLATEADIDQAYKATDPGFSNWASKIRSGNEFYRGMVVSEDELRNVLETGFAVDKTSYGGVFVDQVPERALDFMTVRFKQTPKLGIIFILDLSNMNLEHKFETTWSSKTNIPSTAIKQIWLFDKGGNVEFPFVRLNQVANPS